MKVFAGTVSNHTTAENVTKVIARVVGVKSTILVVKVTATTVLRNLV